MENQSESDILAMLGVTLGSSVLSDAHFRQIFCKHVFNTHLQEYHVPLYDDSVPVTPPNTPTTTDNK
jgi:hypothetical protein